MGINTPVGNGSLRQNLNSLAQEQASLTNKIAQKIKDAASATPEQQGVILAELQQMQNQKALMDKIADLGNDVDKENSDGN